MRPIIQRRVEHGQMVIMLAFMIVVLLGMAALVLDLGIYYREKASLQGVVDAAALAAVDELPDEAAAEEAALAVMEENGYLFGQDGVVGIDTVPNPDGEHSSRYLVRLRKSMPAYFSVLLGRSGSLLEAQAMATFSSDAPIDIAGGGTYGVGGIQNLSVFGPYAYFSYGDCYSPMYRDNGSPNVHYREEGYDFGIYVPEDYGTLNGTTLLRVEIFDPETWNVGNATDAGPGKIDEIRSAPGGSHPQPSNRYTTTRYQLFAPDDTLIASATYGPNDGIADNLTDMKWITPSGFSFDAATYGAGHYRLNVKTLDGSSENGFNLRAGPPADQFNPDNGTQITASGYLPTNFNVSGTVDIEFGYIPPEAAGGEVFITKFDTDVGAKSVTYHDNLGHTWPGVLSGNGTFVTDVLNVPDDYPGSLLYARYQAGAQDTSVWEMHYESQQGGGPGRIFLID